MMKPLVVFETLGFHSSSENVSYVILYLPNFNEKKIHTLYPTLFSLFLSIETKLGHFGLYAMNSIFLRLAQRKVSPSFLTSCKLNIRLIESNWAKSFVSWKRSNLYHLHHML